MQTIEATTKGEIDQISQALAGRIKELAERYEIPLPLIKNNIDIVELKVKDHLEKLGFIWK